MMKIPKLHSRMWLHEFNASARVSNARTARANWKCKTGAGQVISVCALGWCLNEKNINFISWFSQSHNWNRFCRVYEETHCTP